MADTATDGSFSHLEFSPQENLTLGGRSIQIEPLVQDQLRLREELSDRNHQRANGQGPAVGQLEKHNKGCRHRDVYVSCDICFKPAYLNNKYVFSGVSNQEAECLIPLR